MVSDHRSARLSRRHFLGVSMASVGVVATGGLSGLFNGCTSSPSPPPTGGNPSRYPLRVPPTVSPLGLALSAAPAIVDLGGATSSALAYNGGVPGPTIRATTGSAASVAFTNGLSEQTTVHWHGMVVPASADGHPKDAVAPGGYYSYQFPIVQRACMNWYHPHPHQLTGKQVNLGLAGAFIINDAEEMALGLPTGWREVPLIVRDASFDASGNLVYKPKASGFVGNVPLVNGTRDPKLGVETAVYRLRVLDGANARVFRLALSNGAPFTIIGNDGGLVETPTQTGEIEIGPGERLDLLVDFRGLPLGDRVMLRCLNAGWDLLEFEVTRQTGDGGTIPTGTLSTISQLANPVRTRDFSFDGMSRINGNTYDLNRIDFQVPFGETERWRFTTAGNAPHPVHVHATSFQVQSRTGGRGTLYPWERGWKDTVLLQDGETVEIFVRFDDYRGLYLLHCHQLEHEDSGMMANFEVV